MTDLFTCFYCGDRSGEPTKQLEAIDFSDGRPRCIVGPVTIDARGRLACPSCADYV